MDTLIREIDKFPDLTIIIAKWENGLEIKGAIDMIYDTNNGLTKDRDGYKEYYACLLNILEIFNKPPEDDDVEVGGYIDISMQDPPIEVRLEDGSVIWRK